MLKPIVDKFYEEANMYKQRIAHLEKTIENMEKMMDKVVKKKGMTFEEVVKISRDDDDNYAEQALAPPASSLAPAVKQEEKQNVVVEIGSTTQEDNKQVNVTIDKNRKEYMKEYQRNYRKKQKEIALNL
jgi:hypothetical protein